MNIRKEETNLFGLDHIPKSLKELFQKLLELIREAGKGDG